MRRPHLRWRARSNILSCSCLASSQTPPACRETLAARSRQPDGLSREKPSRKLPHSSQLQLLGLRYLFSTAMQPRLDLEQMDGRTDGRTAGTTRRFRASNRAPFRFVRLSIHPASRLSVRPSVCRSVPGRPFSQPTASSASRDRRQLGRQTTRRNAAAAFVICAMHSDENHLFLVLPHFTDGAAATLH